MDDKNLMENMLLLEKGVCDLYLHGSIESSTPEIRRTFTTALNSALGMQSTIYEKMAMKGWYAPDQAPSQQISQVREKFAGQA